MKNQFCVESFSCCWSYVDHNLKLLSSVCAHLFHLYTDFSFDLDLFKVNSVDFLVAVDR